MISEAMETAIQQAVRALEHVNRRHDPVLPEMWSLIASRATAAQRLDGKLIERGIFDCLCRHTNFVCWVPDDFMVPDAAEHWATMQANQTRVQAVHLDYTGTGRRLSIDLVVFRPIEQRLSAYEIKRANGRLDGGKSRSTLRDLRASQAVLQGYGRSKGHVAGNVESRIIFFYGMRSISPPWSLTQRDLDAHFGCPVSAAVAEIAARYRELLEASLRQLPFQPSLALGG